MSSRTVRARITQHEILRRHKGLSMSGLGDLVGCSYSYVSQVEGGHIPASEKYRKSVADKFGVDESLLFDGDGWVR